MKLSETPYLQSGSSINAKHNHVCCFVFCFVFYKNHSKKSFYLSVESRAVSFRRSVEILQILMETLIVSISIKNICFWEKHTRLLKHFRWQCHKSEREMCPSTVSVNRFIFLLLFLPISKPEIQRGSIHPTMSPRGAVQSPHTKAPGNQTRNQGVVRWHSPPAAGLGGLRLTQMKRETSEEIRRSEVTQTEPDKVTAEVTRFASSRSYMQRFIYILRGSFEGVQVSQRQCLSLALLKVFTVCVWFVYFNFLKVIFISKYPPTFWTLDL